MQKNFLRGGVCLKTGEAKRRSLILIHLFNGWNLYIANPGQIPLANGQDESSFRRHFTLDEITLHREYLKLLGVAMDFVVSLP